eukprot:c977_g1_i2.p1 GENE.c977_g1_i2~~c977_g1_i2.p1  ORF type:complete len:244 (+),score=81.49 c977_g1_i2:229-960(+)
MQDRTRSASVGAQVLDEQTKIKLRMLAKECQRLQKEVGALEQANHAKQNEVLKLQRAFDEESAVRHQIEEALQLPPDSTLNDPQPAAHQIQTLVQDLDQTTTQLSETQDSITLLHTTLQAQQSTNALELDVVQHLAKLFDVPPVQTPEDVLGLVERVRELFDQRNEINTANHSLLRQHAHLVQERQAMGDAMERMMGDIERLGTDTSNPQKPTTPTTSAAAATTTQQVASSSPLLRSRTTSKS